MISIIIVTFNNADDILACLDSLPWKTLPMEVLLIDNGSTDTTHQIVDTFSQKNPAFPLRGFWNKHNPGYAGGVNMGLKHAGGQWLLILGPDTILLPDALKTLLAVLQCNQQSGVVAPQLLDTQGHVTCSCRRFPKIRDLLMELSGLPRLWPEKFTSAWKMPDFDHQTARDVDQPEASCLLVRREAFEAVGLMDEQFPLFFNDVDWCRRFWQKRWKIYFEPGARVLHKKGTSVNKVPVQKIFKSHQGFYRYLMKYANNPLEQFGVHLLGAMLLITAVPRAGLEYIFGKKS